MQSHEGHIATAGSHEVTTAQHQQNGAKHYARLAIMTVLSFSAMFILMYAMVDRPANIYSNANQVYMAALMTAPMVAFELMLMGRMYHNKMLNMAILAGSVVLGIVFFALIRNQTGIGDRQFLQSMIPHHSGAILMCNEAKITDPEIRALCDSIIRSQQAEINEMKAALQRLG
jgi:uncharacterized protein (DUF305 family)